MNIDKPSCKGLNRCKDNYYILLWVNYRVFNVKMRKNAKKEPSEEGSFVFIN
ncbi:hypothetical protein ADIS_3933 [Lunatimonas lonarensis]|uniref:Uncharacterized protein n=1 Tax=Lunatimonas lonarensis TaxID=1232681 RepID=R7ZN51_9BACT|nr:hypothetical protein ADIS_3933 [Lunatimonas lonarensis]